MLRRLALKLAILYKLDRFPATNAGGNKYGKAVKIPLSYHRKGMYSQLINCTEECSLQPVTTQSKQFLDTQYKILENIAQQSLPSYSKNFHLIYSKRKLTQFLVILILLIVLFNLTSKDFVTLFSRG